MRRREFVAALGSTTLFPLAAHAQQPSSGRVYRLLGLTVDPTATRWTGGWADVVVEELRRLGYSEGRNLELLLYYFKRDARGWVADQEQFARDLSRLKPDVVFAHDGGQVRSLNAAGNAIPIVASMFDPVGRGFAASLSRPGGNLTGIIPDSQQEVFGKRLQLLRDAVATVSRIGFIVPRFSWDSVYKALIPPFAERLNCTLVDLVVEPPSGEREYRRAFAAVEHSRLDALMIADPVENYSNRHLIVEQVAAARLPAVYPNREFSTLGGFMSYAIDVKEIGRHIAQQVAQILKGTPAGEIPLYQAAKYELVINLKTAKALGIDVPPILLATADEVIE